MRCMQRNKKTFYYANYVEKNEIFDEYGNRTGEYQIEYSEPVKAYGNISPAQGSTAIELFGHIENYDKVIVMDDTNIEIHSILWIDVQPDEPYNYIVKKIAKSLNSVSIAVQKVDVV